MSPLATGCHPGPVPAWGSVPVPLAIRSLKTGVWALSLSLPPRLSCLIFLLFPLPLSSLLHPSNTLSVALMSSRWADRGCPCPLPSSSTFFLLNILLDQNDISILQNCLKCSNYALHNTTCTWTDNCGNLLLNYRITSTIATAGWHTENSSRWCQHHET